MEEFKKRLVSIIGSATQAEVSAKIGITQTRWGRIYRGETYPDAEVIRLLCTAYKIDPTWLLMGQGEMRESRQQEHSEGVPFELEELKNQVKMLKKEIVLLNESLKAKDESLKAKDESLGLYRQMLEQAQKALSTAEKGAIPPIDVLAFAPSAPLTEQDNK